MPSTACAGDVPGYTTTITMPKFLKALFTREAVQKIITDQLYEARRLAVEHEGHAEHHEALARMYRARIERLQKETVGQVGTPK